MIAPIMEILSPLESQSVTASAQGANLRTGAGTAASAGNEKSADNSANSATSKGDTVFLSEEAKALGLAQQDAAIVEKIKAMHDVEIPEGVEVTTVLDVTTATGKNVLIEKITYSNEFSDHVWYSYKANIFSAEGELEHGFMLKEDTLLSLDDAGHILGVSSYSQGAETTGNDIIIGKNGSALSGGDGDDTLITLGTNSYSGTIGTEYGGKKTTLRGGAGDDAIYVVPNMSQVDIDSGSGDDVVDASGGVLRSSTIETGSGNDSVYLGSAAWSEIDTGAGDDRVHFHGSGLDVKITTGAGDDIVESDASSGDCSFTVSSVDTGEGNDTFRSKGLVGSDINLGKGNDFASTGSIRQSEVQTGDGDDVLESSGDIRKSTIDMGEGDDSLSFLDGYDSIIDMGEGDNAVTARSFYSSSLRTGNGDDTIKFSGYIGNSYIYTGRGSDVFQLNGDIISSTLDTGDDDDEITITGNAVNNRIYAGEGNDRITISGEKIEGNAIYGGGDRDRIVFSGSVNENDIYSGEGNDSVFIVGEGEGNNIHDESEEDNIDI